MNYEILMTAIILVICWVALTLADLAIAGLAALIGGTRFKTVFLWGLLSLAIPVIAITYGALIERNWYRIRNVTIESAELPASFDGFTIAQVSDIHLRSFASRPNSLRRAISKINSTSPDIVCFTGDLVSMDVSELDGFEDILQGINAPVYSVLGNHDYHIYAGSTMHKTKPGANPDTTKNDTAAHSGTKASRSPATIQAKIEQLKTREKAMGWNLLLNENRIITRSGDRLAIIGVENTSATNHFPTHGDLSRSMQGTEECFRILLSHDPTHWDMEVTGKDIPLTLSGHTHAIQFSLFGWCPSKYLFKQYRGLYTNNDQYLYVNIGLGETIFPARIGTRPEITLISLKKPPQK